MLLYLGIILIVFLCSIGLYVKVMQQLLPVGLLSVIALSIGLVGTVSGAKIGSKIKKADEEEVKREDDVLLEAVGFSQSVLLVLVNIFLGHQSLILSILIVISGVGFYSLRGCAKIKNSQILRYVSMYFLALAISNSLIIPLFFTFPSNTSQIFITFIYLGTASAFTSFVGFVFTKRYGIKVKT